MQKQTKSRKHCSKEFKASVLQRLEPPTTDTVKSLSEELNIPKTTIYQWLKAKNNNSVSSRPAHKRFPLLIKKDE